MAQHKRAGPALAGVSFIESSIFPIPPDLMLIPMVQANHSKAWRYAFICSAASVLGGIFGYAIGMFFFEALAQPVLESLGKAEKMDAFRARIAEYGSVGVFGAALTPFPYKVVTIMSGAIPVTFHTFVTASIIGRFLRFFLVAGVVKTFGDRAEYWLREHFAKFTIAMFVVLATLYLLYRQFSGS